MSIVNEPAPSAGKLPLDRGEKPMPSFPKMRRPEGNKMSASETPKYALHGITVRDMPYIVMHMHVPIPFFRLFREIPPTATLSPHRRPPNSPNVLAKQPRESALSLSNEPVERPRQSNLIKPNQGQSSQKKISFSENAPTSIPVDPP
jgi:hypothetical protein